MTKFGNGKQSKFGTKRVNAFCEWTSSKIDANQSSTSYTYHKSINVSLPLPMF